MALDGNSCGSDVLDAIQAVNPEPQGTYSLRIWQAILTVIFDHIEANALVTIDNPTALVDTAGTPPSPSHTGTATGGIS